MALLCIRGLHAQDPQFTQLWANPLYLNPAFTGDTKQWRVVSNARTQWTSTSANYQSAAISAEGNFNLNSSGLGLQVLYDQTGLSKLTYVSAMPSYSYEAKINRLSSIRLGMNLGIAQRYHNTDSYVFASDIADSEPLFPNRSLRDTRTYFDIGAGIAYVHERLWLGVSALHLSRPNYSLGAGRSILPVKYSAHTKINIPLKKTIKKVIVRSADVVANWKQQGEWDQIDAGLIYNTTDFSFGLLYRGMELIQNEAQTINSDAVIAVLGYKYYGMQLYYSYDLTVSELTVATGGSHELSIILEYPFRPEPRKRSMSMIPCPSW